MAIVDINGQPFEQQTSREPQTSRLAQLHEEFAEHPSSGLTPAKLAAIPKAAEGGDIKAQC